MMYAKVYPSIRRFSTTQQAPRKTLWDRLPSRNWLIFMTTSSSIIAGIRYDTHLTKQVHGELVAQVKHLADAPMQPTEFPSKILVVIAPPCDQEDAKRVRKAFKEHVKPILDAAALDYELIETKAPGELKDQIAQRCKLMHAESTEKEEPTLPEMDGDLEALGLRRKDRPLQQGVLAVGRATWRELLEGLESLETMEPLPLGYIPFANRRGMRHWPAKIVGWFNDREQARLMGLPTVSIALEHTRPFALSDADAGVAEEAFRTMRKDKSAVPELHVNPRIIDQLRMYTSTHTE